MLALIESPEEVEQKDNSGEHGNDTHQRGSTPDKPGVDDSEDRGGNDEPEGNGRVIPAVEVPESNTEEDGDHNEDREEGKTGIHVRHAEAVSRDPGGDGKNTEEGNTGKDGVAENNIPAKGESLSLIAGTNNPGGNNCNHNSSHEKDQHDVSLESSQEAVEARSARVVSRRTRESR